LQARLLPRTCGCKQETKTRPLRRLGPLNALTVHVGTGTNISGYATYQELEISGIKLFFRYDQCYTFIDISRYISSDTRRRGA
jgi:hypothetical protein